MEQAEAAAREQYCREDEGWMHEEVRTGRLGNSSRRRQMKDVEDIEETK